MLLAALISLLGVEGDVLLFTAALAVDDAFETSLVSVPSEPVLLETALEALHACVVSVVKFVVVALIAVASVDPVSA